MQEKSAWKAIMSMMSIMAIMANIPPRLKILGRSLCLRNVDTVAQSELKEDAAANGFHSPKLCQVYWYPTLVLVLSDCSELRDC